MWWTAWMFFGAVMAVVGLTAARRLRGYEVFLTAGRAHGAWVVALSIAATAIGATATVGLLDQAVRKGWGAFWFMGAAALGLVVQGATVAARIRESGVRTFGELVERQLGRPFQTAISILILLGWTAIIAAQFKAAGELAAAWGGGVSYQWGAALAALFILAYTLPAGQRAVIATDGLQFLLVAIGLIAAARLAAQVPHTFETPLLHRFSGTFGWREGLHHLLVIGGLYVLSPNLVSRSVAARDGAAARWGTLLAAPLLAGTGLLVVWTGLRAASGGIEPPVFGALLARAGTVWKWGVGIGILAAIVSSADTTLLVTASIAQNDLVRLPSVTGVRVWEAGLAGVALALVLLAPAATLFDFLFAAYEMFTPAVVPLLLVAFFARREVARPMAWGSFVVGGLMGLYGPVTGVLRKGAWLGGGWPAKEDMVTTGFLVAFLLALWGVLRSNKEGAS